MTILNDPATLQSYNPQRKTHIVADTSEVGTQCSIYQEKTQDTGAKTWVPIDHVSRALTEQEQDYSPIERESLGLQWGLEQFRYYVVGSSFTAWTDHEPLLPIYNNQQKLTSKRISKHRDRVQDLCYQLRYLKGKEMPCDYGSRHPNSLDHLTKQEQASQGFDVGNTIYVRKIINLHNSPNAIDIATIKEESQDDPEYQKLLRALKESDKNPPQDTLVSKTIYSGHLKKATRIHHKTHSSAKPYTQGT